MQVKAKVNILYKGDVYETGTIFEMDECTAAINEKYNRVIVLGGGSATDDVEEEFEPVAGGLPDLIAEKASKKKK